VGIANIDLWNRAATGALHHDLALLRIQVDTDAFDLGDTLGFEQALGADAVRARCGVVQNDVSCHDESFRVPDRFDGRFIW
jgi:hypothetical protein